MNVDPFDQSEVFKRLLYNPHCFFLPTKKEKRQPEVWTQVSNTDCLSARHPFF